MLSIIIPTYNSEKYIRECLDSILNQTFTDYEIIIVNDCSTDNTLNIINDYLKKNNRIKLINNSVNVGVGKCRIIGFNETVGEYIWYIDSDDYIVGDNLLERIMFDFFNDSSIDMIVFPYISESKIHRSRFFTPFICNDKKCKEKVFQCDNFATIWNRIVKKEIYYKDNNMFSGRIVNEPPITYFKLLFYCEKIKVLTYDKNKKGYYFYRKNDNSISNNVDEIKMNIFLYVVWFNVYYFLRNEMKNEDLFLKNFNKKELNKKIQTFLKIEKSLQEDMEKKYNKEYNEIIKYIKIYEKFNSF